MRRRQLALDEERPELRTDSTLRALAELDSIEPSRALDRAVLSRARAAAQTAGASHRSRARRVLGWSVPAAAIAAAAVCAVAMHQRAPRTEAAHAANQPFVVVMQSAPSGSDESRGRFIPSFAATESELSNGASRRTGASDKWSARRRVHPPELIDSVDLLTPPPLPPPAPQSSRGLVDRRVPDRGSRGRQADPNPAAPARPRASPASR